MTYKTTAFPSQDTKVILEKEVSVPAGETYETDIFSTDGYGRIIGMIYTAASGIDYKIWQGPSDAESVNDMITYSTRPTGDKYAPSTDAYTKNSWEVAVVGKTGLVQLTNSGGSAASVKTKVYLRRS